MSAKWIASLCVGIVSGAVITYCVSKKKKSSFLPGLPSAEEVECLIKTRRTIQPADYDRERCVPKHVVEKLLESANWAPTHGKTQPWRFIIISDKQKLLELGEKDAELYKKLTPADKFKPKRFEKKKAIKAQSDYIIAICMDRQVSEAIPEVEEIMAIACAMQNVHLHATALGVGCYWHSDPSINSKEMIEFLGFKGNKPQCLGLYSIGYNTKKHPKGYRGEIQEKCTWI